MKLVASAVFGVCALVVSACSPEAVVKESTPLPTPAPTRTSPPATTAEADTETCIEDKGEVEQIIIDSEYFEPGFRFWIYTPPCYESRESAHYPVLYLIHGQTFSEDQWDRIGADEAADILISSGEVAPFIIVMPHDHNSLRPTVGFFDDAVLEELLPWVDENYRTIPEREYRAIGGLSRGASWAIHFALTNPDLFGALGGHSPPVFIEEANKVTGWLEAIPSEMMPRLWLDIGERDLQNIMDSAVWFESVLEDLGIPHEWHLFRGNHDEEYWSNHVKEYLRWYADNW
ncbi:MAG: alpha/beta hydrolase [Anaerolineales bacterium]